MTITRKRGDRERRLEGRRPRLTMRIGAVLVVLSTTLTACTPGEIEQTVGFLTQSFEQAGLEGAMQAGAWIAPEVAMRVGMRLGSLGF